MLQKGRNQLLTSLKLLCHRRQGVLEQIHILLSVEGQVGQDQLGALGQVASVDGLKQLLNAEIFTGITAFALAVPRGFDEDA